MRGLSLALGRDPGYVAALLDPTRPSRARPTPDDLLDLSDATGIPLVELLETLWAIPMRRLLEELGQAEPGRDPFRVPDGLSPADRRTVADLAQFLAERRQHVSADENSVSPHATGQRRATRKDGHPPR
jgi:hypothetical protein